MYAIINKENDHCEMKGGDEFDRSKDNPNG
jgi:hypothetical protein